jgi:polar amino acid transport system substrate-binding protein
MRLRPITAAVAALFVASTAAACGGSSSADGPADDCKPAHEFKTIEEGTLTVAGYDLPPYSKLDGKKITGVDGEIVAAIAAKECLTITPKWMATAAVIPTVQSGRADLAVGNWYRTKARTEVVSLSGPMYADQMAIISKDGVSDISQLKGKKVGTVDGYLWVKDLKSYLGGSLKIYSTTLNMNQDLKAGRIDIGVDSYGSGKFNNPNLKVEVAKSHPDVAASQEPAQSSLPVPKDNAELLKAVNEDIKELHESGDMATFLDNNNLPKSAAETGEPRLIG